MAPRDSDVFVEYGGISAPEPSRSTSRTVLVLVSPEAPARAYPLGRRSVPEVCVLLRDGVNLAAACKTKVLSDGGKPMRLAGGHLKELSDWNVELVSPGRP